ncbi:MAG: hypothetical protein IV100_00580 [Myxococcales bacterium]|nr:hypothetical protein [Myxococcales bacterium]
MPVVRDEKKALEVSHIIGRVGSGVKMDCGHAQRADRHGEAVLAEELIGADVPDRQLGVELDQDVGTRDFGGDEKALALAGGGVRDDRCAPLDSAFGTHIGEAVSDKAGAGRGVSVRRNVSRGRKTYGLK